MLNTKFIVFLSCVFIVLLSAIILVEQIGVGRTEYDTLFQLSFRDMDFETEITGDYDESTSSAGYVIEAANGEDQNRIRSWGIAREKDNKTPRADPGAPELLRRYQGIYLADTGQPVIYLTFDEGYENGYTDDILDVLARQRVNAIFFITGPYLNQQEALVRRMLEEGHAVGNHTVGHFSLPTLNDEKMTREVADLDSLFYEKFSRHMTFLRPPKGEYSEHSLAVTSEMGYINVFWSFAYDDWNRNNQKGWEHAYNKVMPNLHNGAVLLLHAVSSDNAQALERIIEDTRKKGYEFGDVFDLIPFAKGETQ
jgi:peptidoglycan-N-acetylmuramic acid deacetylase